MIFLGIACTAGVKVPQTGVGGGGGVVIVGNAGTTGSGGGIVITGNGGQAGTMDPTMNPDAGGCMQLEVKWEPKIPTVFILVDRSGSEFDSGSCVGDKFTTGVYFALRAATLQVIQQLEKDVRFGFGAFVGNKSVANGCPTFNSVPGALENYSKINALYSSLGSLPCNTKADTPAVQVIPMVKAALQADTGTGQKYMLFVTDSQTDFCDDGGPECPADAVTYQIQDLQAAGIGTMIIGLPTDVGGGVAFNTAALQNFANAGAGQPVALPPGPPSAMQLYYNCTGAGSGQWMSMYTAAGRTGTTPLATYSATGGTARVFSPGSESQAALTQQLQAALAGVKSCTFDLSGRITVALDKLDRASVAVQGTAVPLDPSNTNGWNMTDANTLQLFGSACDAWRKPEVTDIKFDFPCSIIIP